VKSKAGALHFCITSFTPQPCQVGGYLPHFADKKGMLRKAKQLAQGQMAGEWTETQLEPRLVRNPDLSEPHPQLLP
jgi:hypothetical protein